RLVLSDRRRAEQSAIRLSQIAGQPGLAASDAWTAARDRGRALACTCRRNRRTVGRACNLSRRDRPMNKIAPLPAAVEALATGEDKITVLNPVGYPPKVAKKAAAPRLDGLDGKTIYLVDCRFDDSIELLKQVQAWFAEHMPGVKTRIISLSATYQ